MGKSCKRTKIKVDKQKINCDTKRPTRGGKEAQFPCRICGYALSLAERKKVVSLACCDAICHKECWLRQECTDELNCLNIKCFLRKDRRSVQKFRDISKKDPVIRTSYECQICQQNIDLTSEESRHKQHLVSECSGVRMSLKKYGKRKKENEQLIDRLAHLGYVLNPTTSQVMKRSKGGKYRTERDFRGMSALGCDVGNRPAPENSSGIG